MSINDRILQISKREGLSIAAFARKIQIADQTVRSVCVLQRNKPGYEFLANLVRAFEWLNPTWLLTGDGDMIIDSNRGEIDCGKDQNLKQLIDYLRERDDKIEKLIEEKTTWKILYEQILSNKNITIEKTGS